MSYKRGAMTALEGLAAYYPEQRICQIVSNALLLAGCITRDRSDIFYVKDDDLTHALEEYLEFTARQKHG